MKLLSDVNVLLALVAARSAQHQSIRQWVQQLPPGNVVLICRHVQMALLRLLCAEVVMGPEALRLAQAWGVYARLLDSGRFAFVLEPPRLDEAWAAYCAPFGQSPKVVADAYLAAFAQAGGYRLITLDKAFAQFPGLDWQAPA